MSSTNESWRAGMRVLTAVLFVCAAGTARAIPFELVVPTEVGMNTFGGSVTNFNAWGWITGDGITDEDLDAATLTRSFSNPDVTVSNSAQPSAPGDFTLTLGEYAGFYQNNANTNNNAFWNVAVGEVTQGFYLPVAFSFPANYTGTGVLTMTLALGSDSATFDVDVTFTNGGHRFVALDAQQLASVPEPHSVVLVGFGLVGLAAHARRLRGAAG